MPNSTLLKVNERKKIMNPLQLALEAGLVINTHVKQPDARYHLCFWLGKIGLLPIGHTDIEHPVIKTGTGRAFDLGFSFNEWNSIGNKMYKVLKELRT